MSKTKESWETKAQFKNRLLKETMEDLIINDMIESETKILIDEDRMLDSKYSQLDIRNKEAMNVKAYQYFSDQFEALKDEHPRVYEGMDFVNFVKIFPVGDEFLNTLRETPGLSDQSIELTWQKFFNQDSGSFKIAALNGFKMMIEGAPHRDEAAVDNSPEKIRSILQESANLAKELKGTNRTVDPLERNNNPFESFEGGAGSPWDKV